MHYLELAIIQRLYLLDLIKNLPMTKSTLKLLLPISAFIFICSDWPQKILWFVNYVLFKCSAFKKAKMLFALKNICSRIQEQWWNCNMILRLSVGGPLFPLSSQWSILPLALSFLLLFDKTVFLWFWANYSLTGPHIFIVDISTVGFCILKVCMFSVLKGSAKIFVSRGICSLHRYRRFSLTLELTKTYPVYTPLLNCKRNHRLICWDILSLLN